METQSPVQLIANLERPIWFSVIRFMEQDITFIKQLLTAPIYKQNVPNVFERLTKYLTQTDELGKKVSTFIKEVAVFKKSLENYPEEGNPSIDEYYYGRHKHFKDEYIKLDGEFLQLKSKIFCYISTTLLSPTSKN